MYLLLIHSGDPAIQRRILAALQQRPEDATSVLFLATDQEPDWERLDYVEASQNEPPFWFWVEVLLAGQVTTTKAPAQNQRKQSARHLACLKWLEAFVSDELVSPAQRQLPRLAEPTTSQPGATEPAQVVDPDDYPLLHHPLEDEQNFVGLLQQLAQSLGWALPAYQFKEASPEFICTCTVQVQEQMFIAREAATQKKKAKHAASKAMFIQLQRWFQYGERVEVNELEIPVADLIEVKESQTTKASAPISYPILVEQLKDGQNFIGLFQQLCQTKVWDFPEYEFSGETPEFICTCTVCVEGQHFSGEAVSAKKKKAKSFSAKAVLLELQHYFQSSSERGADS